MDRITTFVLLLVFTQLAMRAQTILDKEHNLPLVGDELRKVLVDEIDYKSKVIDLTDKVLDSNQHIVKYFSLVEDSTISFSKIDDGILSSYSFMGGSLFLNGCENNQTRVTFLNPIKILVVCKV